MGWASFGETDSLLVGRLHARVFLTWECPLQGKYHLSDPLSVHLQTPCDLWFFEGTLWLLGLRLGQ
jgi:hypothetical protein